MSELGEGDKTKKNPHPPTVARRLDELNEEIRSHDEETLPESVQRFTWSDNNLDAVGRKLGVDRVEAGRILGNIASEGVNPQDVPFDVDNARTPYSENVKASYTRRRNLIEKPNDQEPVSVRKRFEKIRAAMQRGKSDVEAKIMAKLGDDPEATLRAVYAEEGSIARTAEKLGISDVERLGVIMKDLGIEKNQ
ncbi:MAG TPA: hypothetical protein VG935_02845 [Patescibacteria group bacterium]|nr:hypothetical protein [Patescibacteria group bacterium]